MGKLRYGGSDLDGNGTGDLAHAFGERHRLSLEYLYLLARPAIALRPASRKDQLLQLNYRLLWGT
ncbi:MAG: hypothetical protein AUJ52_12170 [Elusimicrobia bacterium CG1_02_63_36]|nr:MAG: hypothetical protein AUJ52_12170 [Elusimicrobia bacterium CG1_02_63_36]PIP84750.1 MAG: hypothetical protein COR54_02405 [Elusimicrobia bacterium CG22_combo_CG10-13_8_21_14_all_63_91]PJA17817.1 MAG: hypothetical protein COX66_03245 [Elusimicrobia bacterium CG_4_10_14_0_2_um_filter_63_34]PJB24639.1 MAG: hypothetical protein CO113_12755 [Elusimicrobia bacterium CG_4_9_14_3_um_filter_62_55]